MARPRHQEGRRWCGGRADNGGEGPRRRGESTDGGGLQSHAESRARAEGDGGRPAEQDAVNGLNAGRLTIWAKILLGCIVLNFVRPNFHVVLDLPALPAGTATGFANADEFTTQ